MDMCSGGSRWDVLFGVDMCGLCLGMGRVAFTSGHMQGLMCNGRITSSALPMIIPWRNITCRAHAEFQICFVSWVSFSTMCVMCMFVCLGVVAGNSLI